MKNSNDRTSTPTDQELAGIRAEAMDFANVGIYRYRPDGTLLFIDTGALRLLDLEDEVKDPAELVGRNLAALLEYVGEPGRLRRAVLEHGKVKDLEYHYRTRKGEDRWVYHSAYRVFDAGGTAIQVIARDITELKRTTLALAASERRYRTLVESSQQGLAVLSGEQRRLVLFNGAFARLVDLPMQELTNCELALLLERFHPDDRDLAATCLGHSDSAQLAEEPVEVRLLSRDGRVTWVSVLSACIELEGAKACQATLLDITARREADRRRRDMEVRMQGAQRLESLGVLAGGIAHDFNNLLMAILGNAELARIKMAPDADSQRHLRAIAETSQQGAELCRQLLIYSGGQTLTMQPVDLNQIVRDTSSLLRVSISKKAIVELELAKTPPTLAGDPSQLRQVVMNLVVNASEALGDNAGRIVLRTGTEALSRDSIDRYSIGSSPLPGHYVFIEVQDSGCGMDPTTRSRMFEPFFSTKFTGRGLGLAAVLGIVRGHEGIAELESHEGKGTRIRVAFPALPAAPPQSSPSDYPTNWSCTGTVLVVDDEAGARGVAAGLLEALGFQCVQASDGKQGIDFFRAAPDEFTLVVLDLIMPVLDGRECFQALREVRPDVPVLFVSGYGEEAMTGELSQREHTDFLQKPFDFEGLLRRVKKLIES